MATREAMTVALDRVIALFNAKAMDLPDGFFHRRTQFVLNGAPFETLLGQPPTDPLVLMLTRGPAGYRFMAKAVQHALPDARVRREDHIASAKPDQLSARFWLSGTLRGTSDAFDAAITITLTLASTGEVEVASARLEAEDLARLRAARLRP